MVVSIDIFRSNIVTFEINQIASCALAPTTVGFTNVLPCTIDENQSTRGNFQID
jgi:hypothetical protein